MESGEKMGLWDNARCSRCQASVVSCAVGEGEGIVIHDAITLAMGIAGSSRAAAGGGLGSEGGSGSGIVLPAVQDSETDLLVLVPVAPILAVIKRGLGRHN
jgi:hypothetical protein